MAAPVTVDTLDLSGVWVMNKTLSDTTDDVLEAQCIGWILRKAIGLATVTLTMRHFTDPDTGCERIDIKQSATGLQGTVQTRILDWAPRPHEDYIFGKVEGKTRRVQLSEIDDEVLKKGWTEDSIQKGLVQAHVESTQYGWTSELIWGFMEIDGERRHARRLTLTTPTLRLDKVIVYDYQGPLQQETAV